MKITELALEIGISTFSMKQFIQDFDLELSDCLCPNLEVKPDFEKFAKENAEFLSKYEQDLVNKKSLAQIAQQINQPVEKVEAEIKKDDTVLFENGFYRSSVSSFSIDHALGGNYNFVYNYFGKKMPLAKRDFIGYRDLYFYITEMLDPFVDAQQAKDWGINEPNGIMLYGAKGSGKIFWAKKIAEIIDYQYNELKISTINDGKTDLSHYLTSIRQKTGKNVLFIENFGEISRIKSAESNAYINPAAKDIILNTMHQFSADHLVMVGATEELKGIDSEVFSPGRFDILIPVFPPNANERAQMIVRYLTLNLEKDSVLTKILAYNGAEKKPFWKEYASRMKIFSNTMVIDFTQSIKKRLRNKYLKVKNHEIKLDKDLLELSFLESASKLTDDYLASMKTFLIEVSSRDYDVFSARIEALKQELIFFTKAEPKQRAIGFGHNDEKEEKPKR